MGCMHAEPQHPQGATFTSQQGALLYGVEYETTSGAIDTSPDGKSIGNQDAACAVCVHKFASTVYTQWGRTQCSNNHHTEYTGVIMTTYYTYYKSDALCVNRLFDHLKDGVNNKGDNNQGRLVTTEMIDGAADEGAYPQYRELACAVCSPIRRRFKCSTLVSAETNFVDSKTCGSDADPGTECEFSCAEGFESKGSGKYTCDGDDGIFKGGNLVCSTKQKCSEHKCSFGVLREDAASVIGATDNTCCQIASHAIFTRWGS